MEPSTGVPEYDASLALRRCIDPTRLETFFAEYWERGPLIVSRQEPAYFSDLLSLDAVDAILTSTNLRVPGFRLVRQGSQLPVRDYTSTVSMTPSAFSELIDADKVMSLYGQGATIVLQALERSWEPIIRLCKALEAHLGHPVQANMYLTPANAQGFAAHHDTHDTLILQVEGRKRWKIYDAPLPLPLPSQPALPPSLRAGPVQHDFVLEAGDTLYMPRGVIHEALTSDSYSMHITIGIKVWTWADALSRMVDRALDACDNEVEFRRALPLRFAESAEPLPRHVVAPLLKRFQHHLRADGIGDLLAEKYVASRWAYRRGSLPDLSRLETLHAGTVVARSNHARVRSSSMDGQSALSFQGKTVSFPAHASEAVQFIARREQFRVGELPGELDDSDKVVLVKRLIREGLLTLVEESRDH